MGILRGKHINALRLTFVFVLIGVDNTRWSRKTFLQNNCRV